MCSRLSLKNQLPIPLLFSLQPRLSLPLLSQSVRKHNPSVLSVSISLPPARQFCLLVLSIHPNRSKVTDGSSGYCSVLILTDLSAASNTVASLLESPLPGQSISEYTTLAQRLGTWLTFRFWCTAPGRGQRACLFTWCPADAMMLWAAWCPASSHTAHAPSFFPWLFLWLLSRLSVGASPPLRLV